VGETAQLFSALWGVWYSELDKRKAQDLAEQLLTLAGRTQDPGLLLEARHALGPSYLWGGQWATALAHLEQGIALYDPQQHRSYACLYAGHDPGVCCLSHAAWCLSMLGYADRALQTSRDALVLARRLSDPTGLARAHFLIGQFHQFRGDAAETLQHAEEAERLAAEQGLAFYSAGGSILRGWAVAKQGRAEDGLAQIRAGLAAWSTSAPTALIQFLTMFAEVCGNAGKVAEGLAVLAEALQRGKDQGAPYYEPEIHRLKGELLLTLAPKSPADAESCFRQAIASARAQKARSLELRAAVSLSRLYHQQDRKAEAHQVLAEIYGWFTEGFDTVDLREARALLQEVS
jgi:predicted ATPase